MPTVSGLPWREADCAGTNGRSGAVTHVVACHTSVGNEAWKQPDPTAGVCPISACHADIVGNFGWLAADAEPRLMPAIAKATGAARPSL